MESLAHPDHDALPRGDVFAKPIAFNVVAKIGEFEPDGFTGEEAKMMAEPRKILSAPDLRVVATSVRVPVVTGHAVSMVAEFARADRRRGSPRAAWPPRPASCSWTTRRAASSRRRSRRPAATTRWSDASARCPGRDDALALFSCVDNLRKGAALDAIQIAEHLYSR